MQWFFNQFCGCDVLANFVCVVFLINSVVVFFLTNSVCSFLINSVGVVF